ncbi:MAG: UDP-N-acetylmuramoyl-L-alanine--D-glutamate ligase [Candidatus Zipacnadales bacterium]
MALRYTEPPPLEVSGCRVGVIGAACSGVGCARLLANAGASVIVGDSKSAETINPNHVRDILESGAELRLELSKLIDLGPLDLLVLSPGVPLDIPVVVEARQKALPVIGEVELAYRFSRAPIIAISGTNGKGSTCSLVGEMLKRSGIRACVCGNIGNPFSGVVASEPTPDVYVLEVSSFQLETTVHFRPAIACLLNIQEDHLDRHGSLEAYIAAKARLFEAQSEEDWAIVNADDANAVQAVTEIRARRLFFSAQRTDVAGRLESGHLIVDVGDGPREVCTEEDLVRQGIPYIQTVLAAASAAILAGSTSEKIREAIRRHRLPPEVLELVCEANGVRFINSSKATNPAAAEADIESISGGLVVIAGGLDRGLDFTRFGTLLQRRARAICLIGECAQQIAEAASGVPAVFCDTLEEAVEEAYRLARPGDAVLLAPACASWDMFSNYKERGACFRTAANRLCKSVGGQNSGESC